MSVSNNFYAPQDLVCISYIKLLLFIIFVLLNKISIFIKHINGENQTNKH